MTGGKHWKHGSHHGKGWSAGEQGRRWASDNGWRRATPGVGATKAGLRTVAGPGNSSGMGTRAKGGSNGTTDTAAGMGGVAAGAQPAKLCATEGIESEETISWWGWDRSDGVIRRFGDGPEYTNPPLGAEKNVIMWIK